MSPRTDRPLDEPEPSLDEQIRADFERSWREYRKEELVDAAMKGSGGFWDQPHTEDAEAAFAHARRLLTLKRLSDAQRWQAFESALRGLVTEWATWKTEEKA